MTIGRYQQTYNSFSGVDMLVFASGHLLGEIQGLSFTVTREKAPLYTMGSADPRSFSRGKRGIAGSMIFLVFDRSALLDSLQENAYYMANEYELSYEQTKRGTIGVDRVNILPDGADPSQTIGSIQSGDPRVFTTNAAQKVLATARYHDQILPFDITLSASNEYGHVARMQICNVEIMNCGSGMSIDDITTDESCTFVATSMIPWYKQEFIDPRTGNAFDASRSRPADIPIAGSGG